MQPIESMFRRTSHRVTRQRDLFALRAKKASNTFSSETRQASRELANAVRAEAGAWGTYMRESTQKVTGAIAPSAIERTLLVRASVVLRTLEQRVKHRIAKLDGHRTRARITKARKQVGNGVAHISGAVSRQKASASRGRARAS
jgi:hypothetical protein